MRNNPDTGFITGTIEEKIGLCDKGMGTDLSGVKIRIRSFEDETEITWRENSLIKDRRENKIVEVYLNPGYDGRYDELSTGNHVRVHVALIGAWNFKKGGYRYLIGDRTEIIS